MRRTLLVTNDFPPTIGGIQSYLRDFLATQDPTGLTVFASTQNRDDARDLDATLPFEVIRWPRSVMLPTPATARTMAEIIRARSIDNVWFGAAAPLALMGNAARRAGATRIIASTHGHEVGWAMLPGAREMLRRIGNSTDTLTYISEYTLGRFRRAFGNNPAWRHLPSGVDVDLFSPLRDLEKAEIRNRLDLSAETKVITCISRLVPRKGQDSLIKALPEIRRRHPETQLVIVGQGPYGRTLKKMAADLGSSVIFTGRVSQQQMIEWMSIASVFAMPARTRGGGLDVEGLGIVYLEAQACGVVVVAGDSGGAPETVTPESGVVVDGRDVDTLASTINELLDDPERCAAMGAAGRDHVERSWTWDIMGRRLSEILG